MKIIFVEHNIETGEVIEREATAAELAEIEVRKIEAEQAKILEAEKLSAKAALLERLGITEEEARLLLS